MSQIAGLRGPLIGHLLPLAGIDREGPRAADDTRRMKHAAGFTIVELMITIVVLGIALAFAVPNMQDLIMNNRLTSQLNLVSSNLALARNEAVKQNALVIACASTDGAGCTGAGTSWEEGWLIYIDRNGNLVPELSDDGCAEGAAEADGDCLVTWQSALNGPNVLSPAAGIPTLIGYDGSGTLVCDADDDGVRDGTCDAEDTFYTLCDPRGATKARALAISNTGRVSILTKAPNGDALSCGE